MADVQHHYSCKENARTEERCSCGLADMERDAARYKAIKRAQIDHLDADDEGPAAEDFDAKCDELVAHYDAFDNQPGVTSGVPRP